jgi:hypothetical protein
MSVSVNAVYRAESDASLDLGCISLSVLCVSFSAVYSAMSHAVILCLITGSGACLCAHLRQSPRLYVRSTAAAALGNSVVLMNHSLLRTAALLLHRMTYYLVVDSVPSKSESLRELLSAGVR